MNTRFNLAAGFIGLMCFVLTVGASSVHTEDDTIKQETVPGTVSCSG